MARSHGRVLASIWNDEDFLALDPAAQRLYMLLLSQPNLTHAGTITITLRRWARKSAETDEADVRYALELLEETRFVVLDWDTEELLIRTLIRNDGVFKQPKVMAAAANEANAITSPRLRYMLREELERLPLDEVTEKSRDDVAGMVKGLTNTLSTPGYIPRDTPPDTPSQAMQSNRTVTQKPSTRARAHSPAPAPAPAPAPTPAVSDGAAQAPTAQTLLAEFIDQCRQRPPDRIVGQLAKQIGEFLTQGFEPGQVRTALTIYSTKQDRHPSVLASVLNGVVNAPTPAAASELTPRNQRNLALVERMAQLDAQQQGEIA